MCANTKMSFKNIFRLKKKKNSDLDSFILLVI